MSRVLVALEPYTFPQDSGRCVHMHDCICQGDIEANRESVWLGGGLARGGGFILYMVYPSRRCRDGVYEPPEHSVADDHAHIGGLDISVLTNIWFTL